jgi:PAS domain S-box-containing protein
MNDPDAAGLRSRAEEKAALSPESGESASPAEARQTLHELRVHQIELEMQNEELRRAQAELDALRARYFDLYDLAPVGYATVSEKGLVQEENLTLSTLLGVARGTLARQPFSRFIVKEDADSFYLLHKRLLATGQPQSCDLRLVKSDGTPFWAHLAATAAEDPDGAAVCRIALSDITERKQAEEQLHRLNRSLKALAQSNRALLRLIDEPAYLQEICRIIVENCGHAMVWVGYAENDEGKTVRPVASAGFEEGYLETLRVTWADTERGRGPTGTAIRTGKFSACQNMLADPQFSPWRAEALKRGYASSAVFPLLADGRAFGALTIYSRETEAFTGDEVNLLSELAGDFAFGIITLRLRVAHAAAEEAVRQLNAELEQRVQARTAELAATNRELEAFCYSVSHDLRAPLRSMDGFSQALLEDYGSLLDDTGRDFLNRVRSNSQRMGRLIDDLLNLSRLTRAHMRHTAVDLTELAESTIVELRKAEPSRTVDVRIAPGLTATGDPVLLGVALTNLLGNAWKFTGRRPDAVIEVGAERLPVPAGIPVSQTVFYVRDNGAGFDPKYADKLFTPFQRLHAMEEFPGTGIGLATVQRVINRHGGRVWFESAPGQGATFYFTVGANAGG